MFSIDKISPMLIKNELTSNIYNLGATKKLLKDFQEGILGRAVLVYNRYSEQSVCNLTKTRTLHPSFFGEIFENG